MSKEITSKMIQEIAEELQGTCGNLDDALEDRGAEYLALTTDQATELDELTMMCDGCGWWVESGEVDDDTMCEDCQKERDE